MKLVKIKEIFYLLSNETAKHGDYALTCFGKIKMYDKDANAPTLWEYGCCKVLATTDLQDNVLFALDPNEIIKILPNQNLNTTDNIINYIDNQLNLDWYKKYTLIDKTKKINEYMKSLIKDEWNCEAKNKKGYYKITLIN